MRKHSVELHATKCALEEKTSQHEHLWGTAHSLRLDSIIARVFESPPWLRHAHLTAGTPIVKENCL